MPPSPLSHTGKKRKRKGEQDDLHNGRISELAECRRAVLSLEGMASPDKYSIYGQMMADLARSAVAEKRHPGMVKTMNHMLSIQGVDDLCTL